MSLTACTGGRVTQPPEPGRAPAPRPVQQRGGLIAAAGEQAGGDRGAAKWTTQPWGTPLVATGDPPAAGDAPGDRDPPDRDPPSDDDPPFDAAPSDDPPPGWGRIVDDDGNPLPF